jgi:hypothetical protein
MRQPALIATPAPAPYSAPATVGRMTSELRNIQLKSKTRIPPAIVLPMPQAKPVIHGETRCGPLGGLTKEVDRETAITARTAVPAAE